MGVEPPLPPPHWTLTALITAKCCGIFIFSISQHAESPPQESFSFIWTHWQLSCSGSDSTLPLPQPPPPPASPSLGGVCVWGAVYEERVLLMKRLVSHDHRDLGLAHTLPLCLPHSPSSSPDPLCSSCLLFIERFGRGVQAFQAKTKAPFLSLMAPR